VYVRKQGDGILITPAQPSWDDFFDQESAFGDDYLAGREDVPAQPRNF
jgi:antitoxin VapB